MKVALGQDDAHFPEVMSEQLSLFRHDAQALSGALQFASHDKPDEFRLQDTSLSQASLQLAPDPQPASAIPSAARHHSHRLFTVSLPWSGPSPGRPARADALHPHMHCAARTAVPGEADSTHSRELDAGGKLRPLVASRGDSGGST